MKYLPIKILAEKIRLSFVSQILDDLSEKRYNKNVNQIKTSKMETLFKYVRSEYPQTKLVIASQDEQMYFSFLGIEIDECIDEDGKGGLAPVDWYQKELLNFVGYLLFSRQMSTKDELKLRELVRVHFGVEHEVLWDKGMDYVSFLNGSKVLLNTEDFTIYSYQIGNYPTEYYIDQGVYGMYSATEKEVNEFITSKAERAKADLTTI